MNNICITGFPSPKFSELTDVMVKAGMQIALPSQDNKRINMTTWHNNVLSSRSQNSKKPDTGSNIGKIWEKLACDIFLANYKVPVWGWVESQSVWLLDFWKDFEPNTYFLLSCLSPQAVLVEYINSIPNPIDNKNIKMVLDDWLYYHQELLNFYHKNTERCLIFNINEVLDQPVNLLNACLDQWNLKLDNSLTHKKKKNTQENRLAYYLSQKYLKDFPEVNTLYDEINSTLLQLNYFKPEKEDSLSLNKLTKSYQNLLSQKKSKKDKKKLALRRQIKEEKQKNELMLLQLQQNQEELEQVISKNQSNEIRLQQYQDKTE